MLQPSSEYLTYSLRSDSTHDPVLVQIPPELAQFSRELVIVVLGHNFYKLLAHSEMRPASVLC